MSFAGEDFGVPVLTIHNVDPCIEENGENHRTSRYELMTRQDDRARLVVRRGQEFYLHLSLSRDYSSSIDGVSIVFTLDGVERPQYGHGTLVATALLHPGEISEAAWQTTIDARGPNFLRIKASKGIEMRDLVRAFAVENLILIRFNKFVILI